MTLNFPNSAVTGQTYLGGNGVTYTFDGVKWVSAGSGGAVVPVTQLVNGSANLSLNGDGTVQFPGYLFPATDGSAGQILTTDGSSSVYWGDSAGLSVATDTQLGGVKLGEGFTTDVNDKVTTSKLYSTNLTHPTQHYRLELDTNGVIHLPDQSIINGSYMRAIHGSYAGLAAGPDLAHNEDSWVWVDSEGTWISTKYSSAQYTWHFDNTGRLFLPDVNSTNAAISPVADGVSLGTEAGNVSITPGGQLFIFDQVGTLHLPSGGDIVDSAGNSVLSGINQTGNYTFSGDDLEMPPRARLNSGGIGETGAAEFGTEIYKNGSNFVTSSEVYMGSGAGEFRSIYNDPNPQSAPGPSTLTYAGVEDVQYGKFSGIVSQTPGIDSMYTIAVDPVADTIIVGAATQDGHISSSDWSVTLGSLNPGLTVNGIFADTTRMVISGGAGSGAAGATFADQGITLRTGAGEASHSYWIDEFGNYAAGEGFSFETGFGTMYDSAGHVLVTGVVSQLDIERGAYFYDTLAMKYDATGELMWRKAYRLPTGNSCGIVTAFAIDDQDTVYWAGESFNSPVYTFVGLRDTQGNIISGDGSEIPVALKFSDIYFYDIAAHIGYNEGFGRYMYLVGEGYSDTHWTSTVVKINVFDYSIAWARNIALDSYDVYGTQIEVDPRDGSVYTLGYLLNPAKVYINKYLNDGTPEWNYILASSPGYATAQISQTVAYNNGHIYTAILDNATNSTLVSKWTTSNCDHVWTTWIDHDTTHSTVILDLGFDDQGNVICMGWTSDVASADSIYSIYYSKLDNNNGYPVYHNVIINTDPDRYWQPYSTRLGSVKNNRIALSVMNYSDVSGGHGRSNAVTIQLPTDGSLTGDYVGYSIYDYSSEFNARTLTGQTLYAYSNYIDNTIDCASSLVYEIIEVNTSAIIDTETTSRKQTLSVPAPGAVWKLAVDGSVTVPPNTSLQTSYGDININVAGQNWKFGEDGSLTTPGPIISTAAGTVEYKSANDMDLTAANRVKITTSPLNLASFEPADFPGLAGRPGDVIFDYRSQKLRLFSRSGWGYVASTDGVGDIVLPAGGTVRNAAGVSVAYQDQLPHDLSDLSDNNQLLQQVQYAFEENIDGGGASAQYVMAMQADGGFSSTRFGSNSPVWDGDNATTTIYTETFNGGAA
ncbi:hypothetical protein UFOVP29_104 [uncultured Caudovirales phage]|uniref:Uncharacterized protein n=1 Tax=uncultured Caudovirales phage TaxID=2100421 RepID=A0A6J5KKZ3_9CAUD|nr:hypothetical protein UFOVP29_104 [uncultured Caudovirales phage]